MVIIISGLPGSGKTYFAAKLASRLGAIHINSDMVRQAMHAAGKYSFQDKLEVYKEMLRLTGKWVAERKTVIVDATFYHHAMRNLFINMAKKWKTKILFIHIRAQESLTRQRLKMPREYSEADFAVYQNIKEQFEEIEMGHLELESTNDNITIMLNKAIQYIQG